MQMRHTNLTYTSSPHSPSTLDTRPVSCQLIDNVEMYLNAKLVKDNYSLLSYLDDFFEIVLTPLSDEGFL
jgi:hypothetical protein